MHTPHTTHRGRAPRNSRPAGKGEEEAGTVLAGEAMVKGVEVMAGEAKATVEVTVTVAEVRVRGAEKAGMVMTAEAMVKVVSWRSARRQNTHHSHWARWHRQRPERSSSMHTPHTTHRGRAPRNSRPAGKGAEEAGTAMAVEAMVKGAEVMAGEAKAAVEGREGYRSPGSVQRLHNKSCKRSLDTLRPGHGQG
jgi:hypothetical protein